MMVRLLPGWVLAAALGCTFLAARARGDGAGQEAARAAIARGIGFLQADAAKWKAERGCYTCHHGTMTQWALAESRRQGFPVDAAFLTEVGGWARTRLEGIEKPRDPRPGWNMVNTPALYLGAMSRSGLGVLRAPELEAIAGHLERHLEEDGSLLTPATMTPPRPQNGPPPIFQSPEVLTLLALLALPQPGEAGDTPAAAGARGRIGTYHARLTAAPPAEDLQTASLRLLLDLRAGKGPREIRAARDRLLARRNADGGWGQLPSLSSDAFATGQALYVLREAGMERDRPEVTRAAAYLATSQRENGSWRIVPRAHPGAEAFKSPAPIEHYGSAWAVLGLVRAVSP